MSAAIAAPIVLVFVLLVGLAAWHERWHLSGAGGVNGVAFAPGRNLLVSAVGGASQDSMEVYNGASFSPYDIAGLTTVTRDVKDLQPTLAPDGRTVADGSPSSNAVSLWTPR